jgi:hypothetical protein
MMYLKIINIPLISIANFSKKNKLFIMKINKNQSSIINKPGYFLRKLVYLLYFLYGITLTMIFIYFLIKKKLFYFNLIKKRP